MALDIHSSEQFAIHIERQVREHRMTYIDAIIHFCQQRGLDPESIASYVSPKMKTAMLREGQALHLLRKRRELPFDE